MQVLLVLKHVIAVIAAIKVKTNKMNIKNKLMKIKSLKMLMILRVIINDELNNNYHEINKPNLYKMYKTVRFHLINMIF